MIAVIGPDRPLTPVIVRALSAKPGTRVVETESVNGADAVVNVAGVAAEEWLRAPDAAADDMVEQTRRILRETAAGHARSLVHISSAAVYGAWPDNPVPLSEDAPLRPNAGFAYARAHAECERVVSEWRDEHPDVTVTVLRPAIVMGGQGPSWMARAVGAMQGPRPREAARPLQFVHADDVASAVGLAVDHHLAGTYNVAPDGWVPDETARALAGGLARIPLPGWLAQPLARVGWRISRRGSPAAAEPWTMHPWVVANDKLRAAGWEPANTNEEAFVAAAPASPFARVIARRRQEVTLGIAGLVLAGLTTTVVVLVRRRRRRRS